MTFKENMKRDMVNTFLNNDEFSENMTYLPYGGTSKTVKGIIVRESLEPSIEESGRLLKNKLDIYIANDSTYGVTTVKKGFDRVTLADENGNNKTYAVSDILDVDDGQWSLRLTG